MIEDEEQQELETVTDREVLEQLNKEEEMYAITVLEEKKAAMKPNMAAIAEYKKKARAFPAAVFVLCVDATSSEQCVWSNRARRRIFS